MPSIEHTSLLVEHYQKTHEITLSSWEQRNRTFLLLLAVVGGATLLTYKVPVAAPLLADLVAKLFGIEDAGQREELRNSFPYGLIQSILLMVVFYLTVSLYHRTTFILRSYRYLQRMEEEIRTALELPDTSIAFTREGDFYWTYRPVLSPAVGAVYIGMLGFLLIAFLGMRIYDDFSSGNTAFGIADILIAAPTLLFFAAYAIGSSWWVKKLFNVKADNI
jgi:hypothetical protein